MTDAIMKGVPEFFESELCEALNARTECIASFRELGPPDLVHVIKTRPGSRDVGSYHYALGVEASSPAALAAYINTLLFNLEEAQTKTNPKAPWKIRQGTFCCFNAFSRMDVRVEVKIPGGVESYMIDMKGERRAVVGDALWEELLLSSALRAILDESDEPDYRAPSDATLAGVGASAAGGGTAGSPGGLSSIGGMMVGLRKVNPIASTQIEKRFLDVAAVHFWKGWQLGTEPEVQVATVFSNHLVNGIMHYFGETGRHAACAEFLASLYGRDPQVGALLATVYMQDNEEVKAVRVLSEAVRRQPLCYGLLLVQVDFLRRKGRLDLALALVQAAVAMAPSEFCTWAKLTQVYIDRGEYEQALLTLNACPMFTYTERDCHRMPLPARVYLPLKPDPANPRQANLQTDLNGTVFDDNDSKENEVHPELLALPALTLRGTFLRAYGLLVSIASKIGWDALLKHRSNVFVMEEEYRLHRALLEQAEKDRHQAARDDLAASGAAAEAIADDAVVNVPENGVPKEDAQADSAQADSAQPDSAQAENTPTDHSPTDPEDEDAVESVDLDASEPEVVPGAAVGERVTVSPRPAAIKTPAQPPPESPPPETPPPENAPPRKSAPAEKAGTEAARQSLRTILKSKRLSERWLDNLFMVLYSDLRVFTAMKAEISHYKTTAAAAAPAAGLSASQRSLNGGAPGTAAGATPVPIAAGLSRQSLNTLLYRKPGAEWEMYGDLALRLQKMPEAIEAYTLCVQQKLSLRPLMRLMLFAADDGDLHATLAYAARLVGVLDRQYADYVFPSPIARALFKLVRRHGLAKVQNVVISMNLPSRTFRLMSRFFDYAESWRLDGVTW